MRLTRAARRAEAPLDETPDATLHLAQTDLDERVPLGEVSHNATDLEPEIQETKTMAAPKRTKSKRGAKKGAKASKPKVEEEEQTQVVLEDERELAGSPASDAAVEDLAGVPTDDVVQIPMRDRRPSSPSYRAVRLTRRQLAMQEEELSKSQRLADEPSPSETAAEENIDEQDPPRDEVVPDVLEAQFAEPEVAEATPEVEEVVPETEEDIMKPKEEPSANDQTDESTQPNPDTETVTVEPHEEQVAHAQEFEVTRETEEVHEPQEEPTTETHPQLAPKVEETIPEPQEAEVESTVSAKVAEPTTTTSEVDVASQHEPKTLTSEKPCESGRGTPVSRRTSSISLSRSPARSIVESIEAIDALEEALENVIPNFNPTNDENEQPSLEPKSGSVEQPKAETAKKAPLATSKTSKNPTAPKSLKPSTSSRPSMAASSRPSVAASSRPSIAQSSKPIVSRPSMAPSIGRSSSVRAASTKERRKPSGEVTDYLASKRRPISISFPTPPPPPRASKPPTRSTFQLPGEAIAAKLKAAKEERLKREQEGGQRPPSATFKAPAVKSTKPPTKSTFQLPGEAVAARLKAQKEERLAREAQGLTERPASTSFKAPPPPKSTKPPTKPSFQLPGEAVAAKLKAQREERLKREAEEAAKKPTFKARPAPVHKTAPTVVRQTAASKARQSLMMGGDTDKKENNTAAKRISSAPSNPAVSKRISSAPANPVASKRASMIQSKATGREVFNRDKVGNEQREKERREKEEAAKKARAEAAERGRIASREWAQKQKKKTLAAKAEPKVETPA